MTLATLATIAAIGLLVEVIVLVLVVGVIFGIGWKGLGYVLDKAGAVLRAVRSRVEAVEQLAIRAGYRAVAPLAWLYGRAAWLRAFTRGLWHGPRVAT